MAYSKIAQEANAQALIDLCGGNIFDAIERSKKYSGSKLFVATKTLERMAVKKMAIVGYTVEQISEMLSINKNRVERIISKEIECEKKID
jgi:hypothetical protein